jgi:SAM-dependent methyltransferase
MSDIVPFVSPRTGARLRQEGLSLVSSAGEEFPVVGGIPRFVPSEAYTAAFGLEWNLHSQTQLDSRTGIRISQDRLERCLGGSIGSLREKRVLEAGCGAGRFTELLVKAGAFVHSIDMSTAVEANRRNIGENPQYVVAQADLLSPPFPRESFDVTICLGVLQFTPNPVESVRSLWATLKPGGLLVIDQFGWSLSLVTKLAPLYRMALKRLPPREARRITDRLVDIFFPLHWAVRRQRWAQMLLSRVSPCLVYCQAFPELNREQHLDFCRLDTFNHLTGHYTHLTTVGQMRRLLESLEAEAVWVRHNGWAVEARVRKPVKAGGD